MQEGKTLTYEAIVRQPGKMCVKGKKRRYRQAKEPPYEHYQE